jgi:AcrR family transcriptional regulator
MTSDSGTDDTRQRILDAALKLFGTIGYTRATTRAIAEQAGVNEVTLFRHFGSKQNLLLACIQAGNRAGFAQTFPQHLTGDYAADIRRMARLQMADTRQHFDILRLLLCDAQAVAELQTALINGAADNREHLAAYFRQQIAAGTVRAELHPLALAQAFDSLFSASVLLEQLIHPASLLALPADDVVEMLADIFVQGTRRLA